MKETLLKKALEVLPNAYAPYSDFFVAAALECADGSIFTGVNVENAAFGDTLCAERSALTAAVSAGKREFVRILVIGGKHGNLTQFSPPCGSCRQVMRELCTPDFEVILYDGKQFEISTLKELLPRSFSL